MRIFLYLFFSPPIFAESIILKSGQKIEGKILKRENGNIKIDICGIPVTYYDEEIQSIEVDISTTNETKDNMAKTYKSLFLLSGHP